MKVSNGKGPRPKAHIVYIDGSFDLFHRVKILKYQTVSNGRCKIASIAHKWLWICPYYDRKVSLLQINPASSLSFPLWSIPRSYNKFEGYWILGQIYSFLGKGIKIYLITFETESLEIDTSDLNLSALKSLFQKECIQQVN